MCRVYLMILSFLMSVCLVAMDSPQKSGASSIIALDIFDNNFQKEPSHKRFLKESSLFIRSAIDENPLILNKKLFYDCLRRHDAEEAFFLVEESGELRENCSLAKKIWDVGYNRCIGFLLVPHEDYDEKDVSRDCIVKTFLLLACKKKNKGFLCEYQRKYGSLKLHKNIGNDLYEEVYGTRALQAVIGKNAYDEFKLGKYINEHLKKFRLLFSDEYLDNRDD